MTSSRTTLLAGLLVGLALLPAARSAGAAEPARAAAPRTEGGRLRLASALTLPAALLRDFTSIVIAADVSVGVTSGSASAKVTVAVPSVSLARALTLTVTLMDLLSVACA